MSYYSLEAMASFQETDASSFETEALFQEPKASFQETEASFLEQLDLIYLESGVLNQELEGSSSKGCSPLGLESNWLQEGSGQLE
jgi:hypothetical protein